MNILDNKNISKQSVSIYYPERKLTELAEEIVKKKTGFDVKLYLDYYDVSQYGLYTINVSDLDNLNQNIRDALLDKFKDPEYGREFTYNVFSELTDGYGIGGECREYKGFENPQGLDLPIRFKLEDYLKFKESKKETNWTIPVTWEVASIVNVKAKTIESAYNKVKNDDLIPLPEDSFYIDGSFRTTYDEEDIQLVKELYNKKDGEYDD